MPEPIVLKTRTVQTNDAAIELLRLYLDLAEKGEIIAVAIVGIEPSGVVNSQASETDHLPSLIGGLTVLQFRMLENRRVL